MTNEHHRSPDRYIRLGVGHPTGDPARHRVFDIRATYSAEAGGWVARLGEQNLNDQFQGFGARLTDGNQVRAFATPAVCLGDAVTTILAMVDGEQSSLERGARSAGGNPMNIQTTNTPPGQRTIQLNTGGAPQIQPGGLFAHEGRIWRAVQVTGAGVTGEWVPNQDVTREELPILPLR